MPNKWETDLRRIAEIRARRLKWAFEAKRLELAAPTVADEPSYRGALAEVLCWSPTYIEIAAARVRGTKG